MRCIRMHAFPSCRTFPFATALLCRGAGWFHAACRRAGYEVRRRFVPAAVVRVGPAVLPPRVGEPNDLAQREADLTIELIRSLDLHALSRPRDERDPLWKQAREAAAEFQRTKPSHPRLFLVRVQDALTLLAIGEVAREEAEAANSGPAGWRARRSRCAAAKALEMVYDAIEKEIPARRRADIWQRTHRR